MPALFAYAQNADVQGLARRVAFLVKGKLKKVQEIK
jgi:hypothetical protein